MDTDTADTAEEPETHECQSAFWAGETPPDSAAAVEHSGKMQQQCERRSEPSPEDPTRDSSPAEVSPVSEPVASGSGAAADDGSSEGDRPAGVDEEDDTQEVRELRNALRMLVYERDVDSINNGGPSSREGEAGKNDGQANGRTGTEPEREGRGTSATTLNSIPGLVNRVIEEHYTEGTARHEAGRPSPRQDGTMTELLLAVIVEFAEPHLARAARRRLVGSAHEAEGGRSSGRREGASARKRRRRNENDGGGDEGASTSYDERAVSWTESCVRQVLRAGGGGDDGGRCSAVIPELDALLGATGEHDGAAMDDDVREAVLLGYRAHRSLFGGGGGADGRGEGRVEEASPWHTKNLLSS